MKFKIKYPSGYNTDDKKNSLLLAFKNKMIAEHCLYGEQYKNGVITEQEWRDYLIRFYAIELAYSKEKNKFIKQNKEKEKHTKLDDLIEEVVF